jgi:iron(III) transport system permease protein
VPASPALVITATVVALALAFPLAAVVWQAWGVGPGGAIDILRRPLVPTLLWNTIQLTVLVSAGCAIVGIGAAWCVERTDLPGRRIVRVLLVLPLAVPEFVAGFGWVSLFPSIQGLTGATLVMTFSLYPWVYLPVVASLRQADPAADEVARSLGIGAWSRFWRVTMPEVRLAAAGGVLVVSLYLLAEYGAFAILRFRTLATAIYTSYTLGFDAASASVLALVLCVAGLLLLTGEYWVRGRRPVRGGGRMGRPGPTVHLGWWGVPVAALLLGVVVLGLGVPVYAIVHWLFASTTTTLPPSSVLRATLESLLLGGLTALAATALALPVALLSVRHPSHYSETLERGTYLVRALPGIAIGLSFVTIAVHHVPWLYQSTALLVAAYVVLAFPLALVAVRACVARVPPILEETARSLGTPRRWVLWRITLPLIAPGLGAAAALVWLTATTELTATLLLRPTGVETLATRFWAYTSGLAYGAAAPYAAIMVVVSAVPVALLLRLGPTSDRFGS